LVLGVVNFDQILDNGTRFPESEVGIWVMDGWQPAVGVDGEILRFLDIRQRGCDYFVRKIEFF